MNNIINIKLKMHKFASKCASVNSSRSSGILAACGVLRIQSRSYIVPVLGATHGAAYAAGAATGAFVTDASKEVSELKKRVKELE